MRLQGILFFVFSEKLYQILHRSFDYPIHANLQKKRFFKAVTIDLFIHQIFIELFDKLLNISSYSQNPLSQPLSCQFLIFITEFPFHLFLKFRLF